MRTASRALAAALVTAVVTISVPAIMAGSGDKVKQVSPEFVCMINKKVFKKEQTLVAVEGRNYYGCCDPCVKQLKENPDSRKDVDPVSGKTVDKATAAVGVDSKGNVYFFENTDNLKKFRVPDKPAKSAGL